MSELMAVGQALTMSSIDLLDLVNQSRASHGETIVRHNDFLSRCKDELDEGDYETFVIAPPERGGRPIEAIRMTIDQCRLVGMRESKGVRRWVLNRLNALEAERKQVVHPPVVIPDFMSPAEAARAWAAEFEAKQQAQQALALAAPKVNFFDKVVERTTLMTATQVAQKLGMSAIKLNKHLDELDVYSLNVKRARTFKQWVLDKGLGQLKQTELGYSQPLFTTAGEAWIVERLTSEGVAC